MKTTRTHATEARFARVLIVDDEPDLRTLYELTLLREGHHVTSAPDLATARELLSVDSFDVVLTDMRLPDGLGLELLTELTQSERRERTVVITAYGSAENAVSALKAGAFDYLTKPVDLKAFRNVVRQAWQGSSWRHGGEHPRAIAAPVGRATAQASAAQTAIDRIVGQSGAMKEIKASVAKVARSMAPVLVRGESGTGKELVAQALHACSQRFSGPFVAVNCSAIPDNLLESEFFGSRKGAFTGAISDRPGFFQAAQGGTLFLDEIGDLPLAMQSKLLRAIQERRVRAVGADTEDAVDVRIVSATHKDLATMVHNHSFRQDLYYRINVIELTLPPLRQRRGDLPDLCGVLLKKIACESHLPIAHLSAQSAAHLQTLTLQGNVRELENLLHRAMAMSDGGELDLTFVSNEPRMGTPALPDRSIGPEFTNSSDPHDRRESGLAPDAHSAPPTDLQSHLDAEERTILERTLAGTDYNRTLAAHQLGISLRQIRYRIERLGIVMKHVGATDDV